MPDLNKGKLKPDFLGYTPLVLYLEDKYKARNSGITWHDMGQVYMSSPLLRYLLPKGAKVRIVLSNYWEGNFLGYTPLVLYLDTSSKQGMILSYREFATD